MSSDNQISLSAKDVERLLRDPSAINRADTAEKIGDAFGNAALSADEREIAEEILRTMDPRRQGYGAKGAV